MSGNKPVPPSGYWSSQWGWILGVAPFPPAPAPTTQYYSHTVWVQQAVPVAPKYPQTMYLSDMETTENGGIIATMVNAYPKAMQEVVPLPRYFHEEALLSTSFMTTMYQQGKLTLPHPRELQNNGWMYGHDVDRAIDRVFDIVEEELAGSMPVINKAAVRKRIIERMKIFTDPIHQRGIPF